MLALKVEDKVTLPPRLGALWEPAALLDGLPLLGDEAKRRRAVLDRSRLDEPAADDEARATDAAAAMDGRDPPAGRVVPQHGQDFPHVRDRARQAAIGDREGVVLDVARGDAQAGEVFREVGLVRRELATLGQVDKRPHTRAQELVDFLGAAGACRRPGILACYE